MISVNQRNHHHNKVTIEVRIHELSAQNYIALRGGRRTVTCYGTSSHGGDPSCLSSPCHLASDPSQANFPAGNHTVCL
jgi:hypothetical protein